MKKNEKQNFSRRPFWEKWIFRVFRQISLCYKYAVCHYKWCSRNKKFILDFLLKTFCVSFSVKSNGMFILGLSPRLRGENKLFQCFTLFFLRCSSTQSDFGANKTTFEYCVLLIMVSLAFSTPTLTHPDALMMP